MKKDFLSPVGRLVQGNPFEAQTTNMQGQPLLTQQGQPTQRYFIAVAFAKTDQAFGAFYADMVAVARAAFPALFNAQGQCTHPRFSFKLIDGDGVDDNGRPNNQKEGFAGHWVVKFSSSFPPRCFHTGHYQPHEQIQPPAAGQPGAIRRGYYVRISGSMEGNGQPNKPGIYVNLGMVELVGQGPEIVSGPDAGAVFGASAPQLPPGATALPMNSGAPAAPQMPGMPAAPGAYPQAPAAGAYPAAPAPAAPGYPAMNSAPAMPVAPGATYPSSPAPAPAAPQAQYVAPNPAFLSPGAAGGAMPPAPGTGAPPPAPGFGAPPAPPSSAPQMTAKAGGATYDQFKAQGWTDQMLRDQGYIV